MKAGIWWLAGSVALLALAVSACNTVNAGAAERAVVDSALSRDSALARFRGSGERVMKLSAGAASKRELVGAWVAAVERSDLPALRRLVLSRAEFGWLFYPTTPQGLPPYDVAPDLLWDMLARQTDAGMDYVLKRFGSRPLRLARLDCGEAPSVEGENRLWGPCVITVVRGAGDSVSARLTGPIVEREGRFKFVSYTNDLD